MILKILEALIAIFSSIPIISNWFKAKPNQDAKEARDESREEMDEFRKTGRPPDDGR